MHNFEIVFVFDVVHIIQESSLCNATQGLHFSVFRMTSCLYGPLFSFSEPKLHFSLQPTIHNVINKNYVMFQLSMKKVGVMKTSAVEEYTKSINGELHQNLNIHVSSVEEAVQKLR